MDCIYLEGLIMNVGFIGTGNMGRILLEAFINSNTLEESQLYITNRSLAKALDIKKIYPEINVFTNAADVASRSDILFICVKPLDFKKVFDEVGKYISNDCCVVSITSPLSIQQLESNVSCMVARVIPSITNSAFSGASLISYSDRVTPDMQVTINSLFECISNPYYIDEKVTRVASDLVSCGPAFVAYLLERMIEASTEETLIDKELAVDLTTEMIIGLGKLLETKKFTLPELIEKVCVKGGITGEGIKVFDKHLGTMFNELFISTNNKFLEDKELISKQNSNVNPKQC
jgi:competence protein ComER